MLSCPETVVGCADSQSFHGIVTTPITSLPRARRSRPKDQSYRLTAALSRTSAGTAGFW